jgi:hypothetical protein
MLEEEIILEKQAEIDKAEMTMTCGGARTTAQNTMIELSYSLVSMVHPSR